MQTIEFITYISHNTIQLPMQFQKVDNMKAKVTIEYDELNQRGNYNKADLVKAFNEAKNNNVFSSIKDSISWQRELRNEWE